MDMLDMRLPSPQQQDTAFTADKQPEVPVDLSAPVQEIFSSVQGEGVYVGKRQIFVRFAHCHLKCAYCDTPMQSADGLCHVETNPGGGYALENEPNAPAQTPTLSALPNPVPLEVLATVIEDLLLKARHHSVSFTGGEPLLYHRFLAALFPRVQQKTKTYLETSGTQPEFLAAVLPYTDIIAMDIKLPSATREESRYQAHADFYRLAKSRPDTEVFIKLIFNEYTTLAEMDAVRAIVTDPATPIILQPETSLTPDQTIHLDPRHLWRLETSLGETFHDVRTIPQTHKMLKVL